MSAGPDPPFTKHLGGPLYLLPKRISAGQVEPTKKPYDLVVFGCTGGGHRYRKRWFDRRKVRVLEIYGWRVETGNCWINISKLGCTSSQKSWPGISKTITQDGANIQDVEKTGAHEIGEFSQIFTYETLEGATWMILSKTSKLGTVFGISPGIPSAGFTALKLLFQMAWKMGS